jgi:two-component system sensor histidine kinase/response regulator
MPKYKFTVNSNTILKKINDLWFKLIGSSPAFSLESRIFHSISIGLIILAAFYIPYNFFAGLYVASVSCVVISVFFFIQYYNSRFHGKEHSNTAFALTGIFIFSINYFSNSGINGSTDLIWPAYLLLLLAISPYRQHVMWVTVYLLSFLILHLIEYRYPFLVKYPFKAGRGQFIDRVTAFPIPVVGIYIIIKYIRKSYDKERITVEEKAATIEVRNEQILLQKDQLEQSNTEKNKLMSIISHDLRAPLINIQSYLEMLNENELDSLERPMLEKELLTATNHTMEMLSNLLYWSKSQMEGAIVNLVELNLLSVLKSTLEIEKLLAAKKGISLNYHIDHHIIVAADIDMLQLVVRNLINNAIKFTPQGGIINIDAQIVLNECKVSVNDNGKGIDPDKKEKIFSITSGSSFGTNNEKGVGLGLLLCKEFIERQGGRIGFESTFGQGSSFFIFIPLGLRGDGNVFDPYSV